MAFVAAVVLVRFAGVLGSAAAVAVAWFRPSLEECDGPSSDATPFVGSGGAVTGSSAAPFTVVGASVCAGFLAFAAGCARCLLGSGVLGTSAALSGTVMDGAVSGWRAGWGTGFLVFAA